MSIVASPPPPSPLPSVTPILSPSICLRTPLQHSPTSLPPFHHHRHYLQDGVIFLVENTLFKVPRYMLIEESSIFADMFWFPAGKRAEGKTDAAPIHLLQVEAIDFERLLEVLYPKCFSDFITPTTSIWGESEWKSILHLATRWQMSDIRKLAITRLTSCASATTKIALGREYDHPYWVREGFLALCMRSDPLTEGEAEHLTMKEILGVAAAREKIRGHVVRTSWHGDDWRETKYGTCVVYETSFTLTGYSNHKMVHEILDVHFALDETSLDETILPLSSRPATPTPDMP